MRSALIPKLQFPKDAGISISEDVSVFPPAGSASPAVTMGCHYLNLFTAQDCSIPEPQALPKDRERKTHWNAEGICSALLHKAVYHRRPSAIAQPLLVAKRLSTPVTPKRGGIQNVMQNTKSGKKISTTNKIHQ